MDQFLFPYIDMNINPCSGCPDYDENEHGCKSNGGCGRPETGNEQEV